MESDILDIDNTWREKNKRKMDTEGKNYWGLREFRLSLYAEESSSLEGRLDAVLAELVG